MTAVNLAMGQSNGQTSSKKMEVSREEGHYTSVDILQIEDVGQAEQSLSTLYEPQNFGRVIPGVYRSSYPQPQDFQFLGGLGLKTIVSLVEKDLPEGFQAFMDGNGIKHHVFAMAGTKKTEIPLALMQSITDFVNDTQNHPLLIHCNQGKHRTGCVVGVLRRMNGWETRRILTEYESFAYPKIRETDIKYLTEFDLSQLRLGALQTPDRIHKTVPRFVFLTAITFLGLGIWTLSLGRIGPLPQFFPRRRK